MIPLNGYLISKARGLQIKQMKYKDERIKIMNEVFSGMKVVIPVLLFTYGII